MDGATTTSNAADAKIIIYGAEWCAFCHEAMRYFDNLSVKYVYKNVDLSADDARAAVEKSGQRGIPVLDMDGEIIIGFDRPKIDNALKEKKLVP
jgi:glutaredoxin